MRQGFVRSVDDVPDFRRGNKDVGRQAAAAIVARLSKRANGLIAGTFQCIGGDIDPKAWAHRLREREQDGEYLSLFQAQAWRAALGVSE